MPEWKIPVDKETHQPKFGDTWYFTRNNYWRRKLNFVKPEPFVTQLQLMDWFSCRSTGGLVFEDVHGMQFRFTVADVVRMIPDMDGDTIYGTFGWKKQGTAIYNTYLGFGDQLWKDEVEGV